MTLENDIKKALKEGKLFLGSRSVLKAIKTGKLVNVIYSTNIPKGVLGDMQHYAGISDTSIQEFPGNSVQLGELCGKPFSVLLLGIAK